MFEMAVLKTINVIFRQYLAAIRQPLCRIYIFLLICDLIFPEFGSHAISVGNNNELEIKLKIKNIDKFVRLAGA